MIIQANADGSVTAIVGSLKEETPIDLETIGRCTVKRQGVLIEANGEWLADMFLCGGPVLGPFGSRAEAINGEIEWLQNNVI